MGVVGTLRSDERRQGLLDETRTAYAEIRTRRDSQGRTKLVPLDEARANRLVIDFALEPPHPPASPGIHTQPVAISTLHPYIDWTPFFRTWELKCRYPAILDHPAMGATARELFADAQAMLDQAGADGWFGLGAVVGILPANANDDTIEIYADDTRERVVAILPTERQRGRKSGGQPHLALADFLAPKGTPDWIGAFVVTAGIGLSERVAALKAAGNDYDAILLESLADRLAEASAEYHHTLVRRELWGYAADEDLANDALIAERYAGIRPAPGYPSCPNHAQKQLIFDLIGATEATGATLTENFAIDPAASVAGWYFAHPRSRYFGVGKTS